MKFSKLNGSDLLSSYLLLRRPRNLNSYLLWRLTPGNIDGLRFFRSDELRDCGFFYEKRDRDWDGTESNDFPETLPG